MNTVWLSAKNIPIGRFRFARSPKNENDHTHRITFRPYFKYGSKNKYNQYVNFNTLTWIDTNKYIFKGLVNILLLNLV